MKYKELNLKKIREDNDLDFAHYTYQKGMCSCCYGPKDLPRMYWKNRIIPYGNDYEYILFKNADNGSGVVKKENVIEDHTCIEWNFPLEKLHKVCGDLQKQLGDEYVVCVPKNEMFCIKILRSNNPSIQDEEDIKGYTIWKENNEI